MMKIITFEFNNSESTQWKWTSL